MSEEATDKAKKATKPSGYKIPLVTYRLEERPDLEAMGIKVIVTPDANDRLITINHGPNHVGHPRHQLSYTEFNEFNEKTGNPVFIFSDPAHLEAFAKGGPAAVLDVHGGPAVRFNEEVAVGSQAKAKRLEVDHRTKIVALDEAFGPLDIVASELQEYENVTPTGEVVDCQRVVIEFKPRTAVSRSAHAGWQTKAMGHSAAPVMG